MNSKSRVRSQRTQQSSLAPTQKHNKLYTIEQHNGAYIDLVCQASPFKRVTGIYIWIQLWTHSIGIFTQVLHTGVDLLKLPQTDYIYRTTRA